MSNALASLHSLYAQGNTLNAVTRDQKNNQVVLNVYGGQVVALIDQTDSSTLHSDRHVTFHPAAPPNTNILRASDSESVVTAKSFFLLTCNVKIIDEILHEIEDKSTGQGVMSELQSLRETLANAQWALDIYSGTSIQAKIAHAITPALARSLSILTVLSNNIGHYRRALLQTKISHFWHRVWSHSWIERDAQSLRDHLGDIRMHLQAVIFLINSSRFVPPCDCFAAILTEIRDSVASTDSGNIIPSSSGKKSVDDIMAPMRNPSPHSQRALENLVYVVDHLGFVIPLPIQFFSSWDVRRDIVQTTTAILHFDQVFDRIIKAYCEGRIGAEYVRRGEYHLVYGDGYRSIHPSALRHTVKPGMLLEMSIALRKRMSSVENEEICPRCHAVNNVGFTKCGWIQWHVISLSVDWESIY